MLLSGSAGASHRASSHTRATWAKRACLKRHAKHCTKRGSKRAVRLSKKTRSGASAERGKVHTVANPLVPDRWISWRTTPETEAAEGGSGSEGSPGGGSEESTGSGSGSGSGSGVSGFEPGINATPWLERDVPAATKLGAKLVRIEFKISESAAQLEGTIAGYAAAGIRVEPLAGFYGYLPSPAEAQNLASWVKAFGPGGTFWAHRGGTAYPIQMIEFGNETDGGYQYGDQPGQASYIHRAETYAVRFKEAASGIASTGIGVGLLAQADDETGTWLNGMYSAVPDLSNYVAGWITHPYGSDWKSTLELDIRHLAAHGAPTTIPFEITEWGLATDNGRCLTENYGWNRCMSYQEAGTTLATVVSEMRLFLGSRMGEFLLYQGHDHAASGTTTQREEYFGALQMGGQDKGTYTTVIQSLMAS